MTFAWAFTSNYIPSRLCNPNSEELLSGPNTACYHEPASKYSPVDKTTSTCAHPSMQ